jgi:hypothetical protein
MKTKRNFIDEQTSAIKNEEVIKVDIYEPDAEDFYEPDESDFYEPDEEGYAISYEEYISEELDGQLEYIGFLDELIFYSIESEKNLRVLADTIIGNIGEKAYKRIMYVIENNISYLKQEESSQRESYDSLNECYKKYGHKN